MSEERLNSYFKDQCEKKPEWAKRKISFFSAAASIISSFSSVSDLTKISMPAEFLNPYSTLELSGYRNSIQLPCLLGLKDEKDPMERICKVVRWYLSGLKQEQFEKKPYNPILAEVHKATYVIDGISDTSYVSEQVSHHPPIGNYRIENESENLIINGSIEFSVGWRLTWAEVKTKGKVSIKVGEEEYTIDSVVPDLHITNIIGFGPKRMNWVGRVIIECVQTRLVSELKFSDTGKNVIEGKIGTPKEFQQTGEGGLNNRKEIIIVSGEVGGTISAEKSESKTKYIFFEPKDTTKASILYPKRSEADDLESLIIWEKVSKAIARGDMTLANTEKKIVEDAQRKRHQEKNEYKPRLFLLDANNQWVWADDLIQKIGIFSFKQHINKLTEKSKFEVEYSEIEKRSIQFNLDYQTAKNAEYRLLNRYSNVLPPEATRVKLKKTPDYINANYIDGLIPGTEKKYIATQGPLESTFANFWRMVWETNCSVILMFTREIENGRLKCDRYWPDQNDKTMEVECAKVEFLSEEKTPDLISRKFNLIWNDGTTENSRVIHHFQYTAWPDHGLPVSTTAFLELMHLADTNNQNNGPFIVHCSAGIGRTGTFCTVHSTIEQIKYQLKQNPKQEPFIDIKATILNMRKQRPGAIQTKEQYQFCFLALAEAIDKILPEFGLNPEKTPLQKPQFQIIEQKQTKVLSESESSETETF